LSTVSKLPARVVMEEDSPTEIAPQREPELVDAN